MSRPELVPSAQHSQPAVFAPPLQNGSDLGTVTSVAQLDKKNVSQLPLQAQSQSQVLSQVPVLQPPNSQKASFGSTNLSLTQQKGQVPTETNTEVWTHDLSHFEEFDHKLNTLCMFLSFIQSLWLFLCFVCRIKPQRNTLEDRAMTGTSPFSLDCLCREHFSD